MEINKLMELAQSSQAPYDHAAYTVWLHNKIIDQVRYELWKFREEDALKLNGYVACNKILMLESLQLAK